MYYFCFYLGTTLEKDREYIDVHVRALHGPQIRIVDYDAPGRNVEYEDCVKHALKFFGPKTLVFLVIPKGFSAEHWKPFKTVADAAKEKGCHLVLILQDAADKRKATSRRMKHFVVDGNTSWKKQEVSRYVDKLKRELDG